MCRKHLQRLRYVTFITMKNLFFSLAFMLIGITGFANNEFTATVSNKMQVKGTCSYSIMTTIFFKNGSSHTFVTHYTVPATSLEHCKSLADAHVAELKSQG